MKTSNILLILLFVISISLNSAVPIVANMKLKNRDFVEVREGGPYEQQKFGATKFISLNGPGTYVLIPSDSLMLEVEANQSKYIIADQRGDTLVVINDASKYNALSTPRFNLYLPLVEHVTCTDTNIELRGSLTPEHPRSYRINLFNSKLVIKGRDPKFTPYRQFFGELFVTGTNDSGIDLSSQVNIRNLSLVNIKNTVIDGYSVVIDEINTTFDPKAVVKMRSLRGAIEINATP